MTFASLFGCLFKTKAAQRKEIIAEMGTAVEGKRAESAESECRLRDKLEGTKRELERRSPIAGALVWEGRHVC